MKLLKTALLLGSLMIAGPAIAGTDGTEFQDLYTMVKGWTNGYLGRSIALVFLLIGLGVGVVRGSIISAVGCIAAAMCLLIAPSVIESIISSFDRSGLFINWFGRRCRSRQHYLCSWLYRCSNVPIDRPFCDRKHHFCSDLSRPRKHLV